MEDQKPQVVKSYVRYKNEKPQTKGPDLLLATVLVGSITIMLAVMFWQVTLALSATGLVAHRIHKIYVARAELRANGLPVNYYNGKREYV